MRALKAPVWRGGAFMSKNPLGASMIWWNEVNRGNGSGDLSSGGLGSSIAKELSQKRQLFFGGNARARTADLLRVKQAL